MGTATLGWKGAVAEQGDEEMGEIGRSVSGLGSILEQFRLPRSAGGEDEGQDPISPSPGSPDPPCIVADPNQE